MPDSEFPQGAQNFLRDLSANNNRDWFLANKRRYETVFKQPAASFADNLARKLSVLAGCPVAAKIYRINRDLRFSKDKTPYNNHLRIGFRPAAPTKSSDMENPGFFFSLEPNHYVVGTGVFQLSGPSLERYRQAVADPASGEALSALVHSNLASGCELNDADLKQVPKGFDKQHPRADLLCRKGVSLMRDQELDAGMDNTAFEARCLESFTQLLPLFAWIRDNGIRGDE